MAKTHRSSDKGYASEGAANQDGSLPIYICNDCGTEVVWAESRRTGRKYLVNVTKGYHGQRFYMKHQAHPRDCAEQKAKRVAELNEWFAPQEATQ